VWLSLTVLCFAMQWYHNIDHVWADIGSWAAGRECCPALARPPGTIRLSPGASAFSVEYSCSIWHW